MRDNTTLPRGTVDNQDYPAETPKVKPAFAHCNQGTLRLNNLFAHLYFDDHKPPEQETDVTTAIIEG